MKEEHIRFENWEPGELLDERHLESCLLCREQWQRIRFLREATTSAPVVEVPPFFAGRVAQIAVSSARSFWEVLDRMARRMVPVFASLVLVTAFLLFFQEDDTAWSEDAELVLLTELSEDEIPESLDEMVLVLAQAAWEEEDENVAEQH